MKLHSTIAYLLVGVTTCTAFPAEDSARAIAGFVTPKITWTGQVKPGEDSVSITGTAQEIYKRIIEINPNYDNELGLNSNQSTIATRGLEPIKKRATTSDDWTCAYGNDVNAESIGEGVRYLYRIVNADCSAPPGSPGAGGCSVSSCNSGAGIFLCNDSSNTAHIPCTIIADNAVEVLINCQRTTYNGGNTWTTVTHGQIFSNDHSWNVILNKC
ncbi:uncharacterized protein GGS22DRAFT_200574 [Annulohypoxylon maeteangense]|uniref:uncharacterized protein n=1 Tax=Annulohypoxylon maeteangense TaxID=1927788 RepID=UPI0020083244|nr:uncharacterized protein GGS22DRAFT_200574 [Annulohypoxylon maeteangense]KAI0884916.1 hypothetical protein GGS22DRAFT_200574 [Annulohypoxylon maeteangense]